MKNDEGSNDDGSRSGFCDRYNFRKQVISTAGQIWHHIALCFVLAWKLLDILLRGTQTWLIMFVRILTFAFLLIPGWINIAKFWLYDPNVVRNVPYSSYGSSRRNLLDIYIPPSKQRYDVKHPVIIFVSGGAWIIGYKMWSTLVARVLSSLGSIVVVPDYRNFPQGSIQDMIVDVEYSVHWTINNIAKYGGNSSDITLAGQSAGAHISSCLLIKNYQNIFQKAVVHREEELSINGERQTTFLRRKYLQPIFIPRHSSSISSEISKVLSSHHPADIPNFNLKYSEIVETEKSELEYEVIKVECESSISCEEGLSLAEFSCIKSFIGISGPYNLKSMMSHIHIRGLDASILNSICQNQVELFSPSLCLRKMIFGDEYDNNSQVNSTYPFNIHIPAILSHFPRVLLVHGSEDMSIPIHVCQEFADLLKYGNVDVELKIYDGYSHTDPIVEGPLIGDHRLLIDIMNHIYRYQAPPCPHWKDNIDLHPGIVPNFLVSIARKLNPF